MTTTVLLTLGAIMTIVLSGQWVLVTRRDIDATRDRSLQAHLDWSPCRQQAGKRFSAQRS